MNNEADTKVEKKPSRFASRMAKKRSNLDRKLSKMKSRLRDVEQRKDAFATDNKDKNAETKAELIEETKTEILVDSLEETGSVDIKDEGKPGQKQQDASTDDKEKPETIPDNVSVKEGVAVGLTTNKIGKQIKPVQSEFKSGKGEKKEPLVNSKSHSEENEKASSTSSKENYDANECPEKELISKPKDAEVEAKSIKAKLPVAKPKPKPSALPRSSGLGLGGRASKKVKPTALLQKIIDRLDDTSDLQFVEQYKDTFLSLLKSLHSHNVSVSWYCNKIPAELGISEQHALLKRENSRINHKNIDNVLNTLSNLVGSKSLGSLFVSSWESLINLTPTQAGDIRQFTDIHIVQDLPDQGALHKVIPILERVSRHSGSLIIVPSSLKKEFLSLQHQYEIHRGYTVIESDRIGYSDSDLSEINVKWLGELFEEHDVSTTLIEFSMHRNIMRVAQMLESACDKEIAKLTLVQGLKSPIDSGAKKAFSVTELDAIMKDALAMAKQLFGSKGIRIDDVGHVSFTSSLNEGKSAQALISDLSIDDMVREDELNALKFGANQRKSIDRIRRFRFASKLGFLWKLKPEYIEHLHLAVSDIVISHARNLYKQVTEIVDKHIKQMSTHGNLLPKDSPEANSFKLFKSCWHTDEHVVQAISKASDLNHFRTVLYSKRGNAAPLEAQQGVLKELRESRMFVSQLMAFGMLGAVLLGSSYAVDVLVNWMSGGATNIGDELIQASKSSRGLGRQVRILIAGVAGIGIVFYLGLRMYLRKPEKILDQQRIVDVYSQQLEDVVSGFISESSSIAKEIISADLDRFQLRYEGFCSALPSEVKGTGRKISDQESVRNAGPGQAGAIKRIAELKKWLTSLLSERDSFSIIQAQKTALSDAQQQLNA